MRGSRPRNNTHIDGVENDALEGGAGNDTLDGGPEDDMLEGDVLNKQMSNRRDNEGHTENLKQKLVDHERRAGSYADSMQGAFMRGFGRPIAAIPKSVALAGVAIRKGLVALLDVIPEGIIDDDAAEEIERRVAELAGDEVLPFIEMFIEADDEFRNVLERSIRQIPNDPREFEFYKAGIRFDEFIRENFPVDSRYGDDFLHKVMEGLGSAAPLMIAAAVTGGVGSGLIASAGMGSAMEASARFEKDIGNGVPLDEAMKNTGLSAAYGLVNAVPIKKILGRLRGSSETFIVGVLKGGVDYLLKDGFIEIMERLQEDEGGIYDHETGVITFMREDGAVSFSVGSLLAALTAMAIGKQ